MGYQCIHSFPPWEVPMNRKPRGMMRGKDCYKYYDPTEGNLFSSKGGEVTTQNRFSPLVEFPVDMTYDYDDYNEETPLLQCNRHDFSPAQNRKIPRRVYFSDQKDYMKNAKDYFFVFY